MATDITDVTDDLFEINVDIFNSKVGSAHPTTPQ